jgi:hypothetical protein
VPASAFFLSYSSLASAISRCSRAILRSRLSPASSSLKSPSSSVPSWRIRCLLVDVMYDFRLPSTRSETSAAVASTLEGRNRDLASSMRSREREIPASSSRSSSSSECEGPVVCVAHVSRRQSWSHKTQRTGTVEISSVRSGVSYISGAESYSGVRRSCPSKQFGQSYQVGQVGVFPVQRHVGEFGRRLWRECLRATIQLPLGIAGCVPGDPSARLYCRCWLQGPADDSSWSSDCE